MPYDTAEPGCCVTIHIYIALMLVYSRGIDFPELILLSGLVATFINLNQTNFVKSYWSHEREMAAKQTNSNSPIRQFTEHVTKIPQLGSVVMVPKF